MPQLLDKPAAQDPAFAVLILDAFWREARAQFHAQGYDELSWPEFWRRWRSQRC